MSETGNHSPSQPTEQHGENLLTEPGQEETQVCYLHCLCTFMGELGGGVGGEGVCVGKAPPFFMDEEVM